MNRKCPRCKKVDLRRVVIRSRDTAGWRETVLWVCSACGYVHQNPSKPAPERHRGQAGRRRLGWRD